MGALLAMLPQLLALMNNPTVVALLPVIQQLLAQLGTSAFPSVDPARAGEAGTALFDSEHIKWVQTALTVLGSPLVVDGVLGEKAKATVAVFQNAHGLVADGWPGPKTAEVLRAELLKVNPLKQENA
jgi:peptidoglycan hydrolase-like protein with peptidoglycan-binding domain